MMSGKGLVDINISYRYVVGGSTCSNVCEQRRVKSPSGTNELERVLTKLTLRRVFFKIPLPQHTEQ